MSTREQYENGGSVNGGVTTESEDHMATGPKTGRGYLNGPGLVNFPVDYTVIGDVCICDGCIDLGNLADVQAETARIDAELKVQKGTEAAGDESAEGDVQRGIGLPTNSSFLWTNGVVYYTINDDVPDQGRVADAIEHIEENTAIRFVRRTNQPNYCEIISNGNLRWSSSQIGMRGGRQLIRYSDRHSWQILVHECCHALGVYHEQSRSDRDDFVDIKWNNIDEDALGNFQKKPSATDYYGYDYGSLMHYPRSSFAIDSSKPTIVPKQSGVTIGQRRALSYGDRQTIAKMYQRYFKRGYSGVWRAGRGRYALWVNADWDSFRSKWQEWSNQGLRLHDIHVRRVGRRTKYSGVFLPGRGRYGLWANVTWSSFRNKWQEWSGDGLRLVDLHVHRVGNQNRYSGVFLPGTGGHGLWANVSWTSFHNKWQQWSGQGLRLVDIHVQRSGNQTRYSGVFLPGSGAHALWANVTWSSFVNKWRELNDQGLRLVDMNLHRAGNQNRYSGAFLPGNDSYSLWANVTYESFRAKWQELAEQGLRLIDFEITVPSSGASDVADQSLLGADATDEVAEDTEAFGGIFEGEPLPMPEVAEEGETEQVHGGLGGIDDSSAIGAAEDYQLHGGAELPASSAELEPYGNEAEEFEGDEMPDVPTGSMAPSYNGHGGVVYPAAE